jgi:hypothetical protein
MSEFLFPLVSPTIEKLDHEDNSEAECSGNVGTSVITYTGFVSGSGDGEITIADGVKFGQIKKIFVRVGASQGGFAAVIPNSNKDMPSIYGYSVASIPDNGTAYFEFMWLKRDDSESTGYWAPIVDGISLSATT